MSKIAVATRLGFREQARRPLLIVLLVGLPFFFITRAIVQTERLPRLIDLPGGTTVATNMRDLHGASMAGITIAFLAGLCGVFIMQSARQADRRLVIAGYRPLQAITPRLIVIASATAIVAAVSLGVTAISFTPAQWGWFAVGNVLIGLIYAPLGALAGAAFGRLGGTYVMLFAAMLDIGIVQNPMFGTGEPPDWGAVLPGYGPNRVVIEAGFGDVFHAWGAVVIGVVWVVALTVLVASLLARIVAGSSMRT